MIGFNMFGLTKSNYAEKVSSSSSRLVTLALSVFAFVCVAIPANDVIAQAQSRIYGTIQTVDGEEFEGFIRWDKNEVGWDNILDGTKDRDKKRKSRSRSSNKRHSWVYNLFGDNIITTYTAQSGVRFGYLERLEPDGDNSAIVTLKGGEEVEFSQGSTDIGTDVREILIDDATQGEIELEWDEIEWISFSEPSASAIEKANERSKDENRRLYGTVTTRRRDTFTGYISWDYDESMTEDVLDGYVSGRKRKLRFENIASIERRGSDGSIVITRDGKELRMEDSNDVDHRNNGIVISDASLGRIVVQWDEFDILELSEPPEGRSYDSYMPVLPLKGVVLTEDDESLSGEIIWDADEAYTWELLDGDFRDVSFSIVFSNIASIEKERRGARITLRDGREFRLQNSNDVDKDNKGIFISLDDGGHEEIDWEDFVRVDFAVK